MNFTKILKIFLFYTSVFSQTIDVNALRNIGKSSNAKFGLDRTKLTQENQNQAFDVLDKPVNPYQYIVGPGDQIRINIISSNEAFNYLLTVSPTGELLIPSVAIISVYGLTLNMAKIKIEKVVKKWNQNAKIYSTIEQIRKFKLKVIGQLKHPGLYDVTPMTRVSDLYDIIIENNKKELINQQKEERELKTYEKDQIISNDQMSQIQDLYDRKIGDPALEKKYTELSNRNLLLIRQSDTIKVDLAKFGVTGDNSLNPYLQQEDILLIPLKHQQIGIYGGIKNPKQYEYLFKESLFDLIELSGGLRPDADPRNIEITRYNGPEKKSSFTVNYNESKSVRLNPEDHIMIRYSKQYKRQEVVYLTGEVVHPGVYSITSGKTTLNDILIKSKGFTARADSSKITINNKDIHEIPDRELERIILIPEINRSQSERAYVKARMMTHKGALETNTIWEAKNIRDFILVKNDIITIPENFEYVELLGAVKRPGRYPYKKTYSYKEYIKIAGGLTSNATRKKFVIKSGTGQRLPANKSIEINNGDIIFAAERNEFNGWLVLKDVLSTASQVAVLLFYIDRVSNN